MAPFGLASPCGGGCPYHRWGEVLVATRKHTHEEVLPAPPERVFALLHTPSAIRSWWGAARAIVLPQEGGIWAAAWGAEEDAPDYVTTATLLVFDPPRRIVFGDYRYLSK